MGSYSFCYSSESDSPASIPNPRNVVGLEKKQQQQHCHRRQHDEEEEYNYSSESESPVSVLNPRTRSRKMDAWARKSKKKGGGGVLLEGFVDGGEGGDLGSDGGGSSHGVGRLKSLTDDDLEDLKGCLDLGFGFTYEEIPELCNTLPALELCYSMSQRFLDEQEQKCSEASGEAAEPCAASSSPIANWKISSPGDHPEEVKARLKYWAQTVACTVKLCS